MRRDCRNALLLTHQRGEKFPRHSMAAKSPRFSRWEQRGLRPATVGSTHRLGTKKEAPSRLGSGWGQGGSSSDGHHEPSDPAAIHGTLLTLREEPAQKNTPAAMRKQPGCSSSVRTAVAVALPNLPSLDVFG